MIVADTNLIAYLYFKSTYGEEASAVHTLDNIWYSPLLWRSEFLNVASLYFRRGLISFAEGMKAIESAKEVISNRELPVAPLEVLTLIAKSNCSSYDCEFVALALELKVPLVTYDKAILTAFPKVAISASEFIKQSQ